MPTDTWATRTAQKISVKEPGGKVRTFDLDAIIEYSATKIGQALLDQVSKFAYFSSLYATAIILRERMKSRLELTYADLDTQYRKAAIEQDTKVTETALESLIRSNVKYKEAVEQWLQAREQEEILRSARDSFQQRKDILITLAGQLWREADTDPGARIDRKLKQREGG